jgi:hypothetical protein
VACPNLPPAIPATAVAIGNVLKQWADEGSFVIMRQGAGSCGIMGTQGIASWSFYKFPKESIGGILNDPNSFVLYLPHNEASTDFSWGKYKTYLNPGAGSTVNPTLPVGPAPVVPVVPDLPFKVPAEEQGLSGKAKLAIAAFVAFVAYKLFKKPSYSTNEYEYEDLCLSDPAERPPEKKMCSTIWRGRRVSSSRTSSAGRWTGTSRRSRGPSSPRSRPPRPRPAGKAAGKPNGERFPTREEIMGERGPRGGPPPKGRARPLYSLE